MSTKEQLAPCDMQKKANRNKISQFHHKCHAALLSKEDYEHARLAYIDTLNFTAMEDGQVGLPVMPVDRIKGTQTPDSPHPCPRGQVWPRNKSRRHH